MTGQQQVVCGVAPARRATHREGGVAAANGGGCGRHSPVGAALALRRGGPAHMGGDAALAEDVHGGRRFREACTLC